MALKEGQPVDALAGQRDGSDIVQGAADLVADLGVFGSGKREMGGERARIARDTERLQAGIESLVECVQERVFLGRPGPKDPCRAMRREAAATVDRELERFELGGCVGDGLTDRGNEMIVHLAEEFQGQVYLVGSDPLDGLVVEGEAAAKTVAEPVELRPDWIVEFDGDKGSD